MEEVETIRRFLRAVRRRATLEAGLRAGSLTTAAILASVLVLSLCAVRTGPATFWPTLTVVVLLILTGAGLALGCLVPLRRLRSDGAVARFVGRRHPPLASDLLSAVELRVDGSGSLPHGGSLTMASAFQGSVAAAVKPIDPTRLVPLSAAAPGVVALALSGALLLAGLLWAPSVRDGLGLLMRTPTRFEGAAVAQEPLIGDVRLTYTYPAYTGLPPRVIEGSTGDVVGLKGTKVLIETRTLRSARQALLLLGESGEAGELKAQLDGDRRLAASLTLREGGSYRVWLSPLIGRPVREARSHRIVVEPDRPPEVDILGAADRLELPSPRPVEVAYSARDDFGLDQVDLVYRVDEGPEQRIPLRTAGGMRTAQGKTVFEPPSGSLGPGARVAYHVEAKDRDAVSGAKTGTSRTLYLIIQNPRENLDDRLARQREILDRILATLADRLELGDGGKTATAPTTAAAAAAAQLTTWLAVHQAEESHLALLGRTIDEERRAGSASKPLLATLAQIADRLGRLMRDEAALLGAVRNKVDVGAAAPAALARLHAAGVKHTAELESAALLLDDLIGRQRLEDLASLGKELTNAHKRLQDLLARYNATKDEALRRQLERELRDLKGRIQELARKIAEVKSRNEVPAEWQNMPNLDKAMATAEKLDQLLEKGDTQSMAQALKELGERLQDLQQMLGKNAEDFGNERFAPENRAVTEMMKKLGDLEGDQRGVADDSHSLAGEVDSEASRRLKAQAEELAARAREKVEALRKKLATQPPRDLGEANEDELHRAQESVRQLRRLLPAKEWAEARKESERAASSLRRLRRSLDDKKGPGKAAGTEPFGEEMGSATKLAQELASDLEKLLPRPEDALSPGQRDRSHALGDRQGSLEERARQLSEELNKKSSLIPGADKAGGELKEIGQQMGEASGDLQRGAAREGAGKAQDAAERLAKMRDSMGKRQMGQSQSHREPVRIPGADESKAPREWRQELLDAMREHAPDKFREQVRRYYEELVK
jgi:hypothetical protein